MLEYHRPRTKEERDGYLRYYVPKPVEKLIALGILPPIYAHGVYWDKGGKQNDEMMLVCYEFTKGQDLETFLKNPKPLMLGDAVRVKDAWMVFVVNVLQAGRYPSNVFDNTIVPDDVSSYGSLIFTDTNNLSARSIENIDKLLFDKNKQFDQRYAVIENPYNSVLSKQFSSYSKAQQATVLAELVTIITDVAQQRRTELNIDFNKLAVEWPSATNPVIKVLDTSMINSLPAMDSATCPAIEDLIAQGVQSLMKEVAKYYEHATLLSEDEHHAVMLQHGIIFDRPR